MERRQLSASAERLEPRQLLAVSYLGIWQSNTNSSDESFRYIVDVDNTGTGEIWIRYEALQNRIDIADNPGFGNINNQTVPPIPGFVGPAAAPVSVPAPFSLSARRTVQNQDWNGDGNEDYSSGALEIWADAGTKVFVVNGDALPLALRVIEDLQSPSGNAATVSIAGPIDSRVNPYAQTPRAYDSILKADEVTVQAAMSTASATQLFADSRMSLQNVVTSPRTDAYVGNGDFHLIAGASIAGNLGVYVGQVLALPGVGFGANGGNILIDGTVNGASVTLNTNSSTQLVNIQTGPSGLISGSGSLTLFNSGLDGGEIDVRSADYGVTNVSTGAPNSPVRDIGITIEQTSGNMRIAAVPKSRGQISLKAASTPTSKITIDSNVETDAGLSLEAGALEVNRPLRTTAGNIVLTGNTVTVGSNLTAGSNGVGNVVVKSRTGGVTMSSAAVVAAIDETIAIEAATDIVSEARLDTNFLDLKADRGGITLKSSAVEIRAVAGKGIAITDEDSLRIRSAVAGTGDITVSALGLLAVDTATVSGQGAVKFAAGGGLLVGVVRTADGPVSLAAQAGEVRLADTLVVGGTMNGLNVVSTKGDIVIEPSAAVTVPGEIALSAPVGRVLTPGSVTQVIVDKPGQGYTAAPQVVFEAGTGAMASAVVARSDQVAGIMLAAGGSGYASPVTLTIGPPGLGGTPASGNAIETAGVITGVTVTAAGSGYSSSNPPLISLSGSGGSGSGAAATAIIGSKVSGLQVVAGGSGYVTAPTVALVGGGGIGATARAIVTNGVVTSLQVTNPGTGYITAPTVVFSGGSGSGAQAQALIGGVSSINVVNPGSGYLVPPRVVISAGEGASAAAISVNATGGITNINVSSAGADYGVAPLVEIIDSTGSGTGAVAVAQLAAGQVTGITVTSPGRGYDPATTTVRLTPVSGGGGAVSGAVTVDAAGTITGINVATNGQDYVAPPSVTITDTSGSGRQAVATAQLANGQVVGFVLDQGGIGYDPATTIVTLRSAGNGAAAVANLDANGSVSSITVTNSGSGYQDGAGAPNVRLEAYGSGAQASATVAAGGVNSVTVAPGGGGTNYAAAPIVRFVGGGGSGATARAVIGGIATVSGGSLSWTAANAPLDALLDTFSEVSINLTLPGDLVLTRNQGALTVRGASTKSGSIEITAPSLTIAGDVKPGNFNGQPNLKITLAATAGDLLIDADVGGLVPDSLVPTPVAKTVSLSAANGKITATAPAAPGLVTGETLELQALAEALVRTNVSSVRGSVTSNAANLNVTQTFVNPDGNVLPLTLGNSGGPLESNNGTITVTAGGGVLLGLVDAQPGGGVQITALSIGESPVDVGTVDLRAKTATLTATSGAISLDTNVTTLSGSAPLSLIDIRNLSGAPLAATLASRNGVTLTSNGTIQATSIKSTQGSVSITAVGTTSDISIGTIDAPAFPVKLTAGQSIAQVNPSAPSITGASADLTAGAGSLDLFLATPAVGAVAPDVITLRNSGAMQIVGVSSTSGKQVTLEAAGTLSQSGPVVTTGLLKVTGNGTGDIRLTSAGNQIGSFAAQNVDTAKNVSAGIEFHAQGPLAVDSAGVTGGAVDLRAGGALTQAGAIKAFVSLAAAATKVGSVQLNDPGNSFPVLTGETLDGNFEVVGSTAFSVAAGGIVAGKAVAVGGNGDIVLTALAGNITLVGDLTAVLDDIDLRAPAGTVTQNATSVINAATLRVIVASAPVLQGNNLIGTTIIEVGGNITIGRVGQPTTVSQPVSASGNITILGTNVIIAAPVQSVGAGSLVWVDAVGGHIRFQATGQIVNPLGDVWLWSGADINAGNLGTVRSTVTAGGTLDIFALGKTVLGTNVGSIDATVFDDLDVAAVGALAVAGINASGSKVTLSAAGAITQTAPIEASSLSAASGSGGVILTSNNDVTSVVGTTGVGDFRFNAVSNLEVGSAGISAGAGIIGDGGIELVTNTGNLTLVGNLTALGDAVELRAPNGNITQNAGSRITAETLIWQARSASFQSGNQFVGIGISLTSPGSVRVPPGGIASGPLRIAEVTTVNGDIELAGEDVQIFGLVQAGGPGRLVTIRSTQGDIAFIGNGRVATSAAGDVTLLAAGSVTAATNVGITSVTTGSLGVVAGSAIDVNTDVSTLTASAVDAIAVRNLGPLVLGAAGIDGASIALTVGGSVSQTGPIIAETLEVLATAGTMDLSHPANQVRSVSISNPGRQVVFRDADGLDIGMNGIRGSDVSVTAGGDMSQVGPITADSFRAAATSGFVVLGNPANAVAALAIANDGRRVAFRNAIPFTVGADGIRGNKVTLRTRGHLTQTGPIVAKSLEVVASSGGMLLGHGGNMVDSVTIANQNRLVGFRTSGALSIGAAGVQGGRVTLRAGGHLTQAGAITASALEVSTTVGTVALNTVSNPVSSVAISNPGRPVALNVAGPVTIGTAGIQASTFDLMAAGDVSQGGAVTVGSFSLTAFQAAAIDLRNAGNSVTTFDVNAGTAPVSLTAAGPLTINAAGLLNIGTVVVGSNLRVNTPGNVVIGPQANALLQSTAQLDLRGVLGDVVLVNGGRFAGSPVLVNPSRPIVVGGSVTDPAALAAAVEQVNSLPVIAGTTYEIVVAASMSISQPLVLNRPVLLRASGAGITLFGSQAVPNGLVLGSAASGSSVTNLAFAGFAGTAVRLNNAGNVTIRGLNIQNSGNGLWISGAGAGTTVQGSRFVTNDYAIRLGESTSVGATNVIIGGNAVEQRNTIEGARVVGVIATGFCTGTQLIGTTFTSNPPTRTRFDVRSSRGLTISNTIVST